MSFRLSSREAALRALQLAEACLKALPASDWTWACGDPTPHTANPQFRGRKVPRQWVVAVTWSQNGIAFDGPGLIIVDVELETTEIVAGP